MHYIACDSVSQFDSLPYHVLFFISPIFSHVLAVDCSYLGSEAHAALAAGLIFGGTLAPTRAQRSCEVAVLGGGGGALSSFLLAHFASVATLTLVERDGAVLALANVS